MLVSQVPSKIATETPDYLISIPLLYVMQYVLLESFLHMDYSNGEVNYNVKGWQKVDQKNPAHLYYWIISLKFKYL